MFLILALFTLLFLPNTVFAEDTTDQLGLTPAAQKELSTFYALRSNRSIWDFSDDGAIKRTLDFIDSVDALIAYHGLEKANYPIDTMRKMAVSKTDDDKKKLEMLISASLLHLAHDLHGDDLNLDALYTGWNFHRSSMDIPILLNDAITNGTLAAFFEKVAPQNASYRALAKALQAYSTVAAKGGWPVLAPGPALHPDDQTIRVTQVRARLAAEGYNLSSPPEDQATIFDEELSKTLIIYQVRNGLSPDGRVGPKTQEALNIPVAERIVQIRANMERWRHMPDNFPPDMYTMVNIPSFTVTIVEGGSVVYRGAVIVGRDDRQTPFINSKISNMVINPSWHVPLSIARKDILPKLRKDPHYLEKLGFVIGDRTRDPSGATIDWKNVTPEHFDYQLRQVPGDLNSLGQVKFNFDNAFSVYMHGTPHQELFGKAERDFSSGCVRLEDPERVGEILLTPNKDKDDWSEQRINDTIDSGRTVWISLKRPMPIYFFYWSVFIDDGGQINFRRDIYSYDQLLTDKMKDIAN